MTELRNIQADLSRFRLRVLIIAIVVVIAFGLVAARLVWLQVLRHDDLAEQAESNRTAVVPIVPNRGQILDRNGVVLATNYSAYTLEITPSRVADLEQTIEALSKVVDIQPRDRRRFKKLQEESKSFESLPIRTRLTDEEVARFAAHRFQFPGVEIKARLFRTYPFGELASHVIGYIGRINQAEKERIQESDDAANYRGTDYIGKLGVEQSYEAQLHGTTGVEEIETSAGGRAVRRLASTPATPGNTVVLSIDIKLQKLVEDLFGDRRGALVALDPKTGEVLAFVSKPTFDPNLFVDGIDQENWQELNESIDKPLLNRALRGTYPPGSTYKPFMALAALETGKRTPQQTIQDPGYFMFGNHRFRDDKEGGHGTVDMYKSIVQSCDTYYYVLANDMGVDLMHDELQKFGFGALTGIDIHGEMRGLLPSTEWKRKAYKRPEQQKWYSGETISLGIGQGYNNFTMLQLASAQATLVASGKRFEPRVVRAIENVVTRETRVISSQLVLDLGLKPGNVDVIKRAMYGVTQSGTSTKVFVGAPYQSGGKTGTAQAVTIRQNEKYNASRLAEYQRDHSLYTAFAPLDEPRIALAVIVENAGFGAEAAAPIARRVLDYVIAGRYPSPEDIALVQKGQAGAPVGTSLTVAEVPLPATRTSSDDADIAPPVAFAAASVPSAPAPAPAGSAPAAATPPTPPPGSALLERRWVPRRTPAASASSPARTVNP